MDNLLWTYVIVSLAVAGYLAPSIVALNRTPPHKWSIVVVNVLLGWTVVGWAVALAMAVRDRPQPA
jgi:RsiW-degrading membrane proteinase PrsW (M82 family)